MNIKNERVQALAREAARRTGQTQTGALEAALTQYLDGLDGTDVRADLTFERARQIAVDFAAQLSDADRAAIREGADNLYDETGLPR